MPLVAGKVWTSRRRLMGNAVPAMLSLPFAVAGIMLYSPEGGTWAPWLWFLIAFVVVGWLAVNQFGLYQNTAMRSELARKLDRAHEGRSEERVFVGCARPSYRSIIDAHEDVGFLILFPDRLEFFGDTIQLTLAHADVQNIRVRPNPHTFVGLGKWIAIEGMVEGQAVRFLIEPREKSSLLGNLKFGKQLRARLQGWLEKEKREEPQAGA